MSNLGLAAVLPVDMFDGESHSITIAYTLIPQVLCVMLDSIVKPKQNTHSVVLIQCVQIVCACTIMLLCDCSTAVHA